MTLPDGRPMCEPCGAPNADTTHLEGCEAMSQAALNQINDCLPELGIVSDEGAGATLFLVGIDSDYEACVYPNSLDEQGVTLAYQVESYSTGLTYEPMPFTLHSDPEAVSAWLTARRPAAVTHDDDESVTLVPHGSGVNVICALPSNCPVEFGASEAPTVAVGCGVDEEAVRGLADGITHACHRYDRFTPTGAPDSTLVNATVDSAAGCTLMSPGTAPLLQLAHEIRHEVATTGWVSFSVPLGAPID